MAVKIGEVTKGSLAEKKKIAAGDTLISINGNEINDVLDYRFRLTEKTVKLKLHREAEIIEVTIKKGEWTKLEIEFSPSAAEAGATTGARFTFSTVKDNAFPQVAYIDNLVFRGTATPSAAPAPEAPKTEEKKEEKKEEAPKPAVGAEKILDASLPQSGTCLYLP